MTLDDLELLKLGILVIFAIFAAGHTLRVNSDKMAGDKLRQPVKQKLLKAVSRLVSISSNYLH